MAYAPDFAKIRSSRTLLVLGVVGALLALTQGVSNLAMDLGAEPLMSASLVDLLLGGAFVGAFLGMAMGFFGLAALYGSKLASIAGLARLVLLADIYLFGITSSAPILGNLTTLAIVGLDVAVMVVLFRAAKVRFLYLGFAVVLPLLVIGGFFAPSFAASAGLSIARSLIYAGLFGLNGVFAFLAVRELVRAYTYALAEGLAAATADGYATPAAQPYAASPSPSAARARTLVVNDYEFSQLDRLIRGIGAQAESRGGDLAPGEPAYATWLYDGHRVTFAVDPATGLRQLEVAGGHDPERVVSTLVCDAYLPSLEGYKVSGMLESQLPGELLFAIAAAEWIGVDGKERFYVDHLARLAGHPDPAVAAAASRALQTLSSSAAAA